jgi:hypothetical protein
METLLEVDGKDARESPTAADIAAAVDGPRGEDFFITLHRGDDDYMDVTLDEGELWVETEDGGKILEARSHVDTEAAKQMLTAFAEGRPEWRDLAAWSAPERGGYRMPESMRPLFIASLVVVAACVGLMIWTGEGGWLLVLLGLAFPAAIAFAVTAKQHEVERAAGWTKATARILKSEMRETERNGKKTTAPRVEYEFNVGFHRFRGRRVSLAEIMAPGQAAEALKRYRVGTSVPVYYDAANPMNSVLERDLPPHFATIWGLVAFLAAIVLVAAYWYLIR